MTPTEIEQRLEQHGQLITHLARLCELQNTLLGLIAGQLKQLGAPAPPGIGGIAVSTVETLREISLLLGKEGL